MRPLLTRHNRTTILGLRSEISLPYMDPDYSDRVLCSSTRTLRAPCLGALGRLFAERGRTRRQTIPVRGNALPLLQHFRWGPEETGRRIAIQFQFSLRRKLGRFWFLSL